MKKTMSLLCLALLTLAGLPALAGEAPQAVSLEALFEAPAAERCTAPPAGNPAQVHFEELILGPGPIGGGQCNQAVCDAGEFCCNYSCSTCAPRGGYCTQQICPPVS